MFAFGSSIIVNRAHLAVFKELYVNPHLWPYLGKAGLTKIALKRFSVKMHLQRIVNALRSIFNAFWNIANAFQRKRNALQIHLKRIFKTLSMRWQTLTTRLMKPPRAVWNYSRNRCYEILWNLYYELLSVNIGTLARTHAALARTYRFEFEKKHQIH